MASRQGSEPIRRLGIHRTQLLVDPADEIAIGNIPHEQEQAVRHLVEAAVPQRMAGQGAGVDVAGLRARVGPFVVSAVVEPPVPAELRARWALRDNASAISDQRTCPCSAMYPAATVSEIP